MRDTPRTVDIEAHPAGRLFPEWAKSQIVERAEHRAGSAGVHIALDREVMLLLSGVIVEQTEVGPCTGLYGPGAILGLHQVFSTYGEPYELEVLIDATWLAMPLDVFISGRRPHWAERMCAHLSLEQKRWLSQELRCGTLHKSYQRVTNRVLEIHHLAGRPDQMFLRQDRLASLLAHRRSTISDVMSSLETKGLVRTRRGVISKIDRSGLAADSCGCSSVTRDLATSPN